MLNVLEEMQADQIGKRAAVEFAVRDDHAVAKALRDGEPVDEIFNLEEAAALDEFLRYLEQGGFLDEIERLASRMRVERVGVPPLRYVMLYIVKIALGIEGIAKMSPLLLRDEAMMRRLGFNGREIECGATRRGDHSREPDTVREGPVSSEAVAENIVKLSLLALASFFNAVAVRVIGRVVPEDAIDAVVDCTDYETTEKYEGAGKVKRERPVKVKGTRRPKKVEVVVYGWKVAVLYHARLGLPLSLCIAPIQRSDHDVLWNVVDDAEKNLRACGKRLNSIAMDKGFLDGEDLYKLDQRHIGFVIPAKKSMSVYADAVALASRFADDKGASEVFGESWQDEVIKGYGKQRTTVSLRTTVVAVRDLTSMSTYGPAGHADHKHEKDFKANPINAVVVREWRGRTFERPVTFLTNQDVGRPRKIFNQYDDRSLIENGLFRESKQSWSLQRAPQKSEAGVAVHVYLTLGTLMMTRCCRLELETEAEQMHRSKAKKPPATPLMTGMERYRLQLKVENQDKVIVFQEDRYAIMHVQEMAMLGGIKLRLRSHRVGNYEETLKKFGLVTPNDSG